MEQIQEQDLDEALRNNPMSLSFEQFHAELATTVVANIAVLHYTDPKTKQKCILRPGQVLPFSSAHELFSGHFRLEYWRYQLIVSPLNVPSEDNRRPDQSRNGRNKKDDKKPVSKVGTLKAVITPDSVVGHLGDGLLKLPIISEAESSTWKQAMDCATPSNSAEDLVPAFYQTEANDPVDEFVYDMHQSKVREVRRMNRQVWFLDERSVKAKPNWAEVCEIASRNLEFETMDGNVYIGPPVSPKFERPDRLSSERQTVDGYQAERAVRPVFLPFPMRDAKTNDGKPEYEVLASIMNAPAMDRLTDLLAESGVSLIQLCPR